MTDQAAKLREIAGVMEEERVIEPLFNNRHSNIIAVSSGKGGVGKTNVVTSLSYALTDMGKNVMILDADFGLANIDILLGINPQFSLKDVLLGDKSMKDILVTMPNGLQIIPGSQGVEELANLDVDDKKRKLVECMKLKDDIDFFFIDTSAGIHKNVIDMVLASGRLIVITTPEPTSITDAYSLIKIVLKKRSDMDISLLVNSVRNEREGDEIYKNLNSVLKNFLSRDIDYFGHMVYDKSVVNAVRKQKPFYEGAPNSQASKCIDLLAKKLADNTQRSANGSSTVYNFFKRLFLVS